ncbi:hypothetical protein [Flavobacterium sp.]|uniref:hypothetical protein n=1 Tax=Flavobacterium sp. TaxID=239 RepID=UPI0025B98B86|nr:hypothetical protein [Flavobacterium sp.]MBA4155180.1 hypothetical protein [Flavobacterium sp.]
MKKTFTIILLAILFSGCKPEVQIPPTSKIDAKFIVFGHNLSKTTIVDSTKAHEFNFKNYMDFGFRVENKVYDIEYLLLLNDNGRLKAMEEHKSPNSYLYKKTVKKLPINIETIGHKTLIRFSTSREYIIDGLDTIKIEKVFPKHKLILVGDEDDVRNSFYHYK